MNCWRNDLITNFYKEKKAISFVALKKIKTNSRYDVFDLNKKNQLNFGKNLKSININSGISVVSRDIVKYLSKSGSLEKLVFPKLIIKKKLYGKIYNNDFIDMGTYKDLKRLPTFLKKMYFKPALFLDKDGVINKDIGYLHKKKDLIWRKNIFKFVKKYNDKNYYVFVITNQSGIGRGYYKEREMKNLHIWMNNFFRINGAHIDEFFFAPYFKYSKNKKYKKNKKLRKPNTGMLEKAKKKWDINLKHSMLIGDSQIDKQTAINFGINYKILNFKSELK